jgi:hypothetical protein
VLIDPILPWCHRRHSLLLDLLEMTGEAMLELYETGLSAATCRRWYRIRRVCELQADHLRQLLDDQEKRFRLLSNSPMN